MAQSWELQGNGFESLMQAYKYKNGNKYEKVKPIPIPTTQEVILRAGQECLSGEDRALWFYLYLTGCRISEAVGNKGKRAGIRLDNISHPNDSITVIRAYTEKNRRLPFRNLPIQNTGTEGIMTKEFLDFANTTQGNSQIFTLSRQRAFNHFHDNIKIDVEAIFDLHKPDIRRIELVKDWNPSPHYLRHCRLTHLVELYNFDYMKLMAFAGWSNPMLAMTYVHFNWRMLAEPMQKKQETKPFNSEETNKSFDGVTL